MIILFVSYYFLSSCSLSGKIRSIGSDDTELSENPKVISPVVEPVVGTDELRLNTPAEFINPSNQSQYPISGTCLSSDSIKIEVNNSLTTNSVNCENGSFTTLVDLSLISSGEVEIKVYFSSNEEILSTVTVLKDTIQPVMVGTVTDGFYFNSTNSTPNLSWVAATDEHTGVLDYEISIGTTSGGMNILPWTSIGSIATSYIHSGLTLVMGSTYFANIRAKDQAGNYSSSIQSDGWIVGNYPQVTIANSPLIINIKAAPNVTMIFDNSGSMLWEALPDSFVTLWDFEYSIRSGANNTGAYMPDYDDNNILNVALRTSKINTVYYDPSVNYRRWTNSDGTQYPVSDPTNAKYTPTDTTGIDLTVQQTGRFRWVTNTTATTFSFNTANVPRSGSAPCTTFDEVGDTAIDTRNCEKTFWPMTFYVYKGSGSDMVRINYYRYQIRGNEADRVDLADNTVTSVTSFNWPGGVVRSIEEEKQNFANWFTYNRSRRDAAKNGVTAAFSTLNENYRIGFRPLNVDASNAIFDIPTTGGFSGTNRETWFSSLLASSGSGTTPLRVALARAGEYFKSMTGGTDDPWVSTETASPMSCRQSYTILTTDGYYNDTNTGLNNVNPNILNADGTEGMPYADTASRTLADVAMYYYKNDLRPDLDNRVPTTLTNQASWQHMVTIGVALGLRGSLNPETDLPRLISGEISWPSTATDQGKLDDLWHATVNSRGQFVSAASPEVFAAGLKSSLDSIMQSTASSSNLEVSGQNLSEGSQVFQSRFVSDVWNGDLWSYSVTSGAFGTTAQWKASEQMPVAASRNIFTRNETSGVSFEWANLSDSQKLALDNNSAILDYLRGVRTFEVKQGGNFRNRTSLLGDIIHSSPVFVSESKNLNYDQFSWVGASSYQAFRTSVQSRDPMVYVAANDGMVHAFDATNGVERFAYVPSLALSKMKDLTSTFYTHQFITDGQLAVKDVFDSNANQWRSILIGSQGRGGRQLFALDITDPDNFDGSKIMWEFSHEDFGQFLGEPVLARMNNGQWAVLVGNGYNSDNNQAHLFIIDAITGDLIRKINTSDCLTTDNPCVSNGLSDVTIWDENNDGTVDFAYAGDLRGNVWRFDLNSTSQNNWSASFGTNDSPAPIFRAKDSQGKPQPITSRIQVIKNQNDNVRWISFGTGRYLSTIDRDDLSTQTWYGLYDNYTSGSVASPVTGRNQLASRVVLSETPLYIPATTNLNTNRVRVLSAPGDALGGDAITDGGGNFIKKGWYLDLVNSTSTQEGEKILFGVQAFESTLFATTTVPDDDPCSTGGNGWLMAIDPFTGGRSQTNIFTDRAQESVSVQGQAAANFNVSGVGFLSIPSKPIFIQDDTPDTAAPCTTANGQAGVLVGTSNSQISCEAIGL